MTRISVIEVVSAYSATGLRPRAGDRRIVGTADPVEVLAVYGRPTTASPEFLDGFTTGWDMHDEEDRVANLESLHRHGCRDDWEAGFLEGASMRTALHAIGFRVEQDLDGPSE